MQASVLVDSESDLFGYCDKYPIAGLTSSLKSQLRKYRQSRLRAICAHILLYRSGIAREDI